MDRKALPASDVIERLVGMQAQVPNQPYLGSWSRLRDFRREELTGCIEERRVVRAPLMRSTLHLMTARDYLSLWSAVQPALIRTLRAFFGKRARGLDVDRLVTAARDACKSGR